MTWPIYFLAAFGAVFVPYFSVRLHFVSRVRLAFIHDSALFENSYKKLPSFDCMLYHPRHQARWTKQHWIDFVDQQ